MDFFEAPDEAARQLQIQQIEQSPAELNAPTARALCEQMRPLNEEDRLALLDIAVPTLKRISEMEYTELTRLIDTTSLSLLPNGELLCLYCHDFEHEKSKLAGHYQTVAEDLTPGPSIFRPFEQLFGSED